MPARIDYDLPIRDENIPEELRNIKAWTCWKQELNQKKDKYTKVPYNPRTGFRQDFNKANDLMLYDDCKAAIKPNSSYEDSLWFSLQPEMGYTVIDVDFHDLKEKHLPLADRISETKRRCNEPGHIAYKVINTFDSYTEISASGCGIHVFIKGNLPELPEGSRRKSKPCKNTELDIEVYDRHFIGLTGYVLKDKPIADAQDVFNKFYTQYIYSEKQKALEKKAAAERAAQELTGYKPLNASDVEIINICSIADNSFKDLFNTDVYETDTGKSEADFFLMSILAKYTQCNAEQMERVFSMSARGKRDKWLNRDDYRKITVENAIANCGAVYNPDALFYNLTDDGEAERLKANFGENILYIGKTASNGKGVFYKFNGILWKACDEVELKSYFKKSRSDIEMQMISAKLKHFDDDFSRKMKSDIARRKQNEMVCDMSDFEKAYKKQMNYIESDSGQNHVLNVLKGKVVQDDDIFNQDDFTFNVLNGTIDLKTGIFREHRYSDYATVVSPVEYNKDAKCPKWLDFLDTVTQGNKDEQEYLQKMVGYFMTGATREQKVFFIKDNQTGATGKSTFTNVVLRLLGGYATTTTNGTFMKKSNNDNELMHELSRFRGMRFVSAGELPETATLNTAQIKLLSGADKITGRPMYHEAVDFFPKFKILMFTNFMPKVNSYDGGLFRRLVIIPFTNQIPVGKRVEGLDSILAEEEGSGILNWMIEGCIKWQVEGLKEPEAYLIAKEEYRKEQDYVADMVEALLVPQPDGKVFKGDLYAGYVIRCKEMGIMPNNMTRFGYHVKASKALPEARKFAKGYAYEGYAIRIEYESKIRYETGKEINSTIEKVG